MVGSASEAPSLGGTPKLLHGTAVCLAAAGLGGQDGGLVLGNLAEMKVLEDVLVQFCLLIKKASALQSPGCNLGIAHITAVPEHTSWSSLLFYSWGN